MSQPTASKAIRRLEDIAGLKLFERLEGRLRPTAVALVLAREAERLNDEHDAFEQLVKNIRDQQEGTLRVSMAAALAASIMPRAIIQMSHAHPDIRIHAKIDTQVQIVDDAAWGRIDLGVVDYTEAEPMTTSVPLRTGRIVCIMAPDNKLAEKDVVRPSDLDGCPLIAYHPDLPFARSIRKTLLDHDAVPTVGIEANHTNLVRDLVRLGGGVALVDEFTLWFEAKEEYVVRRFEPAIELTMGVVHARNQPLPRMVRNFLDALKLIVKEPPSEEKTAVFPKPNNAINSKKETVIT